MLSSACEACSRSRCGTRSARRCSARAIASASSRSTTRRSATSCFSRRRSKALLPFLPTSRRIEGLQGLPVVPVLPRRKDAIQGGPRAAAGPLAARPERIGGDPAVLGGLLRARLRAHAATTTRRESQELLEDSISCISAPTSRRCIPERRTRLEHRRVTGRWRKRLGDGGVQRSVRAERVRREHVCARRGGRGRLRAPRGGDRRRGTSSTGSRM